MLRVFLLIFGLSCLFVTPSVAAESYLFQLPENVFSADSSPILHGSDRAPNGDVLSFNRSYMTKNGLPWLPVMGELHFSRLPETEWESSILKMKTAGIDIIATYVFWNHHEENKGVWDWTGCRNLRKFTALCQKHQMYVWARIGPWCHGEARRGGFPDYIDQGIGPKRGDFPEYMKHVATLYKEIAAQMKGQYFKDGGPVIGVQIENEFDFKSDAGWKHMQKLRQLAVDAGMDVPYYSATACPGGHAKSTDFLLGYGTYPAMPWAQHIKSTELLDGFTFRKIKPDPTVGADLFVTDISAENPMASQMPLLTVELGGGNQVTWHRRPSISAMDCPAMAITTLGSGANGIGYYMFHGGVNPLGKNGPLQESHATGYPNDCPLINYDFQSPLGSEGQFNPSFYNYKNIHAFIHDFGSSLTVLPSTLPDRVATPKDTDLLRCAVRGTLNSGFIFIANYQRLNQPGKQEKISFKLESKGQSLTIPAKPRDIPPGLCAIWPYHLDCNGVRLKYATATPLMRLNAPGVPQTFVFSGDGITEFVFENGAVIKTASGMTIQERIMVRDQYIDFTVTGSNGKMARMILLPSALAKNAYKVTRQGIDCLLITDGAVPVSGSIQTPYPSGDDDEITLLNQTGIIDIRYFWLHPDIKYRTTPPNFAQTVNIMKSVSFNAPYRVSPGMQGIENGIFIMPPVKIPFTTLPQPDANLPIPAHFKEGAPLYNEHFKPIPGAKVWTVDLASIKGKVGDGILTFDYFGNTAALYQDGKLIQDDFWYDKTMKIRLSRIPDLSKPLTLQVFPLSDKYPVYFDSTARGKISADPLAVLRSIEFTEWGYGVLAVPVK